MSPAAYRALVIAPRVLTDVPLLGMFRRRQRTRAAERAIWGAAGGRSGYGVRRRAGVLGRRAEAFRVAGSFAGRLVAQQAGPLVHRLRSFSQSAASASRLTE